MADQQPAYPAILASGTSKPTTRQPQLTGIRSHPPLMGLSEGPLSGVQELAAVKGLFLGGRNR
jgi:hypothetical protein